MLTDNTVNQRITRRRQTATETEIYQLHIYRTDCEWRKLNTDAASDVYCVMCSRKQSRNYITHLIVPQIQQPHKVVINDRCANTQTIFCCLRRSLKPE